MKMDERWKLFALYPIEGWFGWWKVRMVCMDEHANFMACVTVAKFRTVGMARDFIQAIEQVSGGYGQLLEDVGEKRTITPEESGPVWSDTLAGGTWPRETENDGKGEKKET